jgi:valyl-tRNA synthetase
MPQDVPDRWILSRLNDVIRDVIRALEEYRFNDGAHTIYQFVWHEFCDWYLEMIKPALYGEGASEVEATRSVLSHVLGVILRLLHPFMPFITEEIWQRIPWTDGSIMVAEFPKPDERFEARDAVEEMDWVKSAISVIRNIRGELSIQPSETLRAIVVPNAPKGRGILERHRHLIEKLARVADLEITLNRTPPKRAVTAVVEALEVFIPIDEALFVEEQRRLEKAIEKADQDLRSIVAKLANEAFRCRAPKEVVEKEMRKRAEMEGIKERLEQGLQRLRGLN